MERVNVGSSDKRFLLRLVDGSALPSDSREDISAFLAKEHPHAVLVCIAASQIDTNRDRILKHWLPALRLARKKSSDTSVTLVCTQSDVGVGSNAGADTTQTLDAFTDLASDASQQFPVRNRLRRSMAFNSCTHSNQSCQFAKRHHPG